ncbi:MAG: histidinol dehydrogenase [Ahniella sp.]|nr:histidinol dehydrogenase [Ahniella sp.]
MFRDQSRTADRRRRARLQRGIRCRGFQTAITRGQQLTRDGLGLIGPDAVTPGNAEGLDAHARSVTIRLRRCRECA